MSDITVAFYAKGDIFTWDRETQKAAIGNFIPLGRLEGVLGKAQKDLLLWEKLCALVEWEILNPQRWEILQGDLDG